MAAYAEAIDQELSTDITGAEISTDALSNESMTPRKQSKSVQLYFVLIMLCTGRAQDRIASAPRGWSMEAWRMLFQAYPLKNNARLVVMMLEVLVTNDMVNSLETMERKIKEFRRYANIEIPDFLKIGIAIRHAEEGPLRTHLIMNSQRLVIFRTSRPKLHTLNRPECGDGNDGPCNGRGCVHERIVQRCFQKYRQEQGLRSCVLVLPIAARNRRTPTKDNRRVRRMATAQVKATRRSTLWTGRSEGRLHSTLEMEGAHTWREGA